MSADRDKTADREKTERIESSLVVPRELTGVPLDRFLASSFPELDRVYLRGLMRDGRVLVDGNPWTTARPLRRNAVVTVRRDDDAPVFEEDDEGASFAVLYDDADVAVVEKPPGVHADLRGTQTNLRGVVGEMSPPPPGEMLRTIEKLDRDASGAMVVAKTLAAARALREQVEAGTLTWEETAIVERVPAKDEFEVDFPLGSDARRTGRRVIDRESGDPARTRVRVEARYDGAALVEAHPFTHRTHQVRVHLAAAGHPLLVDPVYGRRERISLSELKPGFRPKPGVREKPIVARLSMHRSRIRFASPSRGATEVASPLPPDLSRLIRTLEKFR